MNWQLLINSLIYAVAGVAIFVVAFIILDLLTPYKLWEELVEKRNTALAIVVGAAILGICLIVAASVHG